METLSDKLITALSIKKNMSKKDTVKFIHECLNSISIQRSVDYNTLYTLFNSFSNLSQCLAPFCTSKTLKECETACYCVIFRGTCVPRYIPDAVLINNDPDKYALSLKTPDLQKLVEYASYLYYNYDAGGLTDNSFDALEYHLNKRMKTRGKRWEKIGAEPVQRIRVLLDYPMYSLDKLKPGTRELSNFLNDSTFELVWSEKLDGVSGLIVFQNGDVNAMFTRGNGKIGGNVSFLKDYIQLPKPKHEYLVVRGEFVINKNTWREKYNEYANPRSFVSAKINSGYISIGLTDIQFFAHSIIDWSNGDPPIPSTCFKILSKEGFNVPSNGVLQYPVLVFDLVSLYKFQRETSDYAIDGLVLSHDISESPSNGNPEHSKAFKMTLEEQLRDTRVINVEYNITRHGRYFPVAVYNSVYIDGIRLHRASAHNAAHVVDWHLSKDTVITVSRSGDVIPVIKNVIVNLEAEPILPSTEFPWHWEGKDIVLDDIPGNEIVQLKRIAHFFSTIGVPGLGEGRIKKMWDCGLRTITDITNASVADIMKCKGFGEKLATSMYNGIHVTLRVTRLDRYFIAFTTFKTRIGRSLFKTVLREYPDILDHTPEEINAHLRKHKIPGIGPARIESLKDAIPQFRELLFRVNKIDAQIAIDNEKNRHSHLSFNVKIKDKLFVLTGFTTPNYDLEDYIWDHYGTVTHSVTSNTHAVISGNVLHITEKMTVAHSLGVPVYTIPEFVQYFDAPIKESNSVINFE